MAAGRTATIKTIAQALSLSPSTVSRGLKGDAAVTADTQLRIRQAAEEFGYRRDLRGVNLRTGRTFVLCAILSAAPSQEFGDPAAMHLVQGLIAGVEGTDFKIVVRPVESAEQRLAAVHEVVAGARFDGVVLDHSEPQDRSVLYLLEKGIRFITFGRTELFSEHPYFDLDNEDAAYQATRHLLDQGHTRIALVDPPPRFLFSRQRLRGYRRALAERNVPFDEGLVLEISIGARRVRERVEAILTNDNPPTGFVTANEVATIGTVQATRMLSSRAQKRLGFVSRDGTNLFDYFDPPIASCFYPLLDAGEYLAASLVRAVEGTATADLQRVERTQLIVRPHRSVGETM